MRRLRRDPRAHWILLLLGLLLLGSLLTLNGYAHGVLGGSGRHETRTVEAQGPLIRTDGAGQQSRSLPDRTIALTFDDGPDPQWTPAVLDLLARYQIKATFFMIGARVNEHPELARRVLAEGHEIGAHTFTHADLSATPQWRRELEMALTANAIAGATGYQTTLFRPPFSSVPEALTEADYQAMRGYIGVLSDLDTRDWERPGAQAIVEAATPKDGRGAIILMHDGGGDRSQTLDALDQLIPRLKQAGYTFGTVTGAAGIPSAHVPAPAQVRWRGDALRWAQVLAAVVATGMAWLLGIALALAALRLAIQLLAVRPHLRLARRRWSQGVEVLERVSVIVPAFNEEANIAATVRSLAASDYPWLEVIVVDDGSTDRTAEIVQRLALPRVRLIRQVNRGKPAALNTGIRAARAPIIVLVDGDTVFGEDTVYNLVQAFDDPRVGAVAGNTKVANRKGFLGRWQHLEYVIGFNLDRRFFDLARCMPTIPGAIGAFRAEVLHGIRGVPTDTLAEDTDLTMAVLREGWEVIYEEHAIAWTEAPATLRSLWRQRYRWCYGTMQAMWKHRSALWERPNRLRRGLLYLGIFQVALPVAAPAVDVFTLYGLFFLPWYQVLAAWIGLLALQTLTAAVALRLDRESLRPLWTIPFQQIVYRQLMYLVVVQSIVTALIGNRLRWHRQTRTGSAAALMEGAPHG